MKRIIKLTEQDLYRIVKKVINEQIKTETAGKSKTIDIKGNWEAGYYSYNKLPDSVKQDFLTKLKDISDFLVKNPTTDITLTIEVGESQLPNYDKEKNKPLETGDLANLRGETIKAKIESELDVLQNQGIIKKRPIVKIDTIIGSTPYNKSEYQKICGSNQNSNECKTLRESFKKDQFVRIQMSVKTKGECIGNLKISFMYDSGRTNASGKPVHYCNEAIFKVYLNDMLIGTANLNNKGDRGELKENLPGLYQHPLVKMERSGLVSKGTSRICTFTLSTEGLSEVFSKGQNELTLKLKGQNVEGYPGRPAKIKVGEKIVEYKGVHSEVPIVKIERFDQKTQKYVVVYDDFPNVNLKRGDDSTMVIIGTLDRCATKVISGF